MRPRRMADDGRSSASSPSMVGALPAAAYDMRGADRELHQLAGQWVWRTRHHGRGVAPLSSLFYRAQSLQNSRWPQSMSFSGQLGEATDILLVAWFVALPRAIVSTIGW